MSQNKALESLISGDKQEDIDFFLESRDNMYYQVVNCKNVYAPQEAIKTYQKAMYKVPADVLYRMVSDMMEINKYIKLKSLK